MSCLRHTRLLRSRLALTGLVVLGVLAAIGATVELARAAAASGSDGKIAFVSTRDGDGVAYTGATEIYVMNNDGSSQTRLTINAADDMDPAWSKDGQKIAFSSDRDGNIEIYTMNADGSNQTRITNSPGADYSPAWSPSGQKLVFTSTRDGNGDIYTIDADGTGEVRLTSDPAEDQDAVWAANIAFSSNRDGDFEIFTINAAGRNLNQLTVNTDDDYAPQWDLAGAALSFMRNVGDSSEIWRSGPSGSTQTQITSSGETENEPVRSPQGGDITFTSSTGAGDEDIFRMKEDGTGSRVNLTNSAGHDFSPDWQSSP